MGALHTQQCGAHQADATWDYEYWTNQGGDPIESITEWLGEIIAGVSGAYQNTLGYTLELNYINIWGLYEACPYTPNIDALGAIDCSSEGGGFFDTVINIYDPQMYAQWTTDPELIAVDRSCVAFMTSRFGCGGMAHGFAGLCEKNDTYIDTYWMDAAGYLTCSGLDVDTQTDTETYLGYGGWNIALTGHELGHVMGALHTQQCGAHQADATWDYAGCQGILGSCNIDCTFLSRPNADAPTCIPNPDVATFGPYTYIPIGDCTYAGTAPMGTCATAPAPQTYSQFGIFWSSLDYATFMSYGVAGADQGQYDYLFEFHPIILDQWVDPAIEDYIEPREGCMACNTVTNATDCPEGFIWDQETQTCIRIVENQIDLIEGQCICPTGYTLVWTGTETPATEYDCVQCSEPAQTSTGWEAPCVECLGQECADPEVYDTLPTSYNNNGGLWKHNIRCDLYNNYYNIQYPWEIELVESVGQTVEILRSVEYQLESFLYKGKLPHDCGDRFHVLDYNFDEAIIYNTEQVSGVLKLIESPKNDVPEITTYPKITDEDIEILFSKEEQKYRFDMFWDVTKNRGEFNPNMNQTIWKTELNGYIRHLNVQNLDYNKAKTERKKFRHYFNKVLLRKGVEHYVANAALPPTWKVSQDKEVNPNVKLHKNKMLLRLANTKLNKSFR